MLKTFVILAVVLKTTVLLVGLFTQILHTQKALLIKQGRNIVFNQAGQINAAALFNSAKGTPPNEQAQWGVQRINADKLWSKYGAEGQGVRVAIIDTGVLQNHTALRKSFFGMENNGWYDPITCSPSPTDGVGHGTHCAGITSGHNGIGVARKSNWMACRGCNEFNCPQHALLDCSEWALKPTDAKGNNPNITKHAHIVSNSWGGSQNQTWYNNAIKAFKAARILVFFAIGNGGPACGTANSPGDQINVTSIGSTNQQNNVSDFSSRGPNKAGNGVVSPLLVAPGQDINSAYNTGDNDYQILSGTSMATPHAAGSAALLLSQYPEKDRDELLKVLFTTATKIFTGLKCGNTPTDACPNEVSGYGLINVLSAFDKLANVSASSLLEKSFRCNP